MADYIVLYDSCILYSRILRTLFIELAITELFQAKWTNEIHQEWVNNVLIKNPSFDRSKLEETKENLNEAVPDCLVMNYEKLIPSLILPDANDRHVLAAAIQCGAQAIVTNNLKDFPKDSLHPYDMEAIDPDTFITLQMDLFPDKVITAVRNSRRWYSFSSVEFLISLRDKGLIKTTARLENYQNLI